MSLSAFGRSLNLDLYKNENLVPQHRPLHMYFAEADKDDISYIEDNDKVSSENDKSNDTTAITLSKIVVLM